MAYRARVLSSEAAANGDVHLDVMVESDRSGSWQLIPGGHRTLVLDGDDILAITTSSDSLANKRLAVKGMFMLQIGAWGIDKSDDANEQLTALVFQGWPQKIDL
jgi:hypothetical protein